MEITLPCSSRFRSHACETVYRESCLVDGIPPLVGSATVAGAQTGSMTQQSRLFHWRANQGLIFVQEESFDQDLVDNLACFRYGGAYYRDLQTCFVSC